MWARVCISDKISGNADVPGPQTLSSKVAANSAISYGTNLNSPFDIRSIILDLNSYFNCASSKSPTQAYGYQRAGTKKIKALLLVNMRGLSKG